MASKPSRSALKIKAVASISKTNAAPASAKSLVTPEEAKAMYYDMYLGREFEEMCAQMYYRGKMFGFVHLYSGQEAVSTGVIGALRPEDYVCSTYRDHVHALSKGVSARYAQAACRRPRSTPARSQTVPTLTAPRSVYPSSSAAQRSSLTPSCGSTHMFLACREVMAELFGKSTGCCRGQGGSMHIFSAKHNFLGGYAFIGEGIPVGLGAAFRAKYHKDILGDDKVSQEYV